MCLLLGIRPNSNNSLPEFMDFSRFSCLAHFIGQQVGAFSGASAPSVRQKAPPQWSLGSAQVHVQAVGVLQRSERRASLPLPRVQPPGDRGACRGGFARARSPMGAPSRGRDVGGFTGGGVILFFCLISSFASEGTPFFPR